MTLTKMEQLALKAMADAGVDPALARKAIQDICLEKHLYEGTNPVASVEFFKEPREEDRVLELAEEDRLLAECAEPLKTMVLVGLHCGLRMRSEILTLRWTNLDLPRRTLTVAAAYSKNGKTRTVSLNSTFLAALARHPRTGDFVFVKPNGSPYTSVRGFRSASQRAGLSKVTPHTLRHTFASRLLASGVDPIMATKLGGWASIKMLDRYAHADPFRMAEAVEKIARNSSTGTSTLEKPRIVKTA